MNGKRFTFEFDNYNGRLLDNDYQTFYYIEDSEENIELLCNRLNELSDENEQLKSELKELTQKKNDLKELLINSEPVLEQKELQKIIYKMVYVAIDEKIEKAEDGFQQTQDNWYQGQIDALKELKKELQHE